MRNPTEIHVVVVASGNVILNAQKSKLMFEMVLNLFLDTFGF
jgi:hypothetical protein